jgi:serine/threonine protein kinase
MKVAVKLIKKAMLDEEELEMLHNECQVMQKVDHKNVVKYFETYADDRYMYIIMELCTGGELIQDTIENQKINENDMALIFGQLLSALQHIH